MRKNQTGQLTVELASVSIFLTVFSILAVYIGLMVFGATLNDRACRDACRAAAQGKSLAEADRLARATLAAHDTGSGIISPPVLTSITYEDFAGAPPVDESPFVTVITSANANLPFAPPEFFGSSAGQQVTFRQKYTFPIIKVR